MPVLIWAPPTTNPKITLQVRIVYPGGEGNMGKEQGPEFRKEGQPGKIGNAAR